MITKPVKISLGSLSPLSPSPYDGEHMTQRNTFFPLSLFLVTLYFHQLRESSEDFLVPLCSQEDIITILFLGRAILEH